MYFEEWMVECG